MFNVWLSDMFFHPSGLLIAASRCMEKRRVINPWFAIQSLKENNNPALSCRCVVIYSEWTSMSLMGYLSSELCFIGSST